MSRSRLTLHDVAAARPSRWQRCPAVARGEIRRAQQPRRPLQREVSSSIAEGAELTGPVRWQAYVTGVPAGGVVSVRFLIDGKVRHLERQAPYLFAGRGNLLLPGTLGPGSHIFAVDVTLTDGHRLTAATTAVVSANAPGIPRQVLGRWTRTVTAAEVARTRQVPEPGGRSPLPTGTWQVRISADGVARYTDPTACPRTDRRPGALRTRRAAGRRQPDTQLPPRIQGRILRRHRRRRDLPLVTPQQRARRPGRSATTNAPTATASGTAPSPDETQTARPQTPGRPEAPAVSTQAGRTIVIRLVP